MAPYVVTRMCKRLWPEQQPNLHHKQRNLNLQPQRRCGSSKLPPQKFRLGILFGPPPFKRGGILIYWVYKKTMLNKVWWLHHTKIMGIFEFPSRCWRYQKWFLKVQVTVMLIMLWIFSQVFLFWESIIQQNKIFKVSFQPSTLCFTSNAQWKHLIFVLGWYRGWNPTQLIWGL